MVSPSFLRPVIVRKVATFSTAVTDWDHRSRGYAVGRSLLGLGSLITVLLTPIDALLVPDGTSRGAACDGLRSITVLCLGHPSLGPQMEVRRWVLIAVFALVVAGLLPRWTGPLHCWAAFSLSASLTLPDGGEAIAGILSLLLLPMCLVDGRTWHWTDPPAVFGRHRAALSLATALAIRLQMAYIYLDGGLSKVGVRDWANGTAEYYILRDPMFGVSGPAAPFFLWFSDHALGTIFLTWSAIVVEVLIGLLLLSHARGRSIGWTLDVLLHLGIVTTIGLFSFSTVMVGGATIAAARGRRRSSEATRARSRRSALEAAAAA